MRRHEPLIGSQLKTRKNASRYNHLLRRLAIKGV